MCGRSPPVSAMADIELKPSGSSDDAADSGVTVVLGRAVDRKKLVCVCVCVCVCVSHSRFSSATDESLRCRAG